jgi:hypothetical protein
MSIHPAAARPSALAPPISSCAIDCYRNYALAPWASAERAPVNRGGKRPTRVGRSPLPRCGPFSWSLGPSFIPCPRGQGPSLRVATKTPLGGVFGSSFATNRYGRFAGSPSTAITRLGAFLALHRLGDAACPSRPRGPSATRCGCRLALLGPRATYFRKDIVAVDNAKLSPLPKGRGHQCLHQNALRGILVTPLPSIAYGRFAGLPSPAITRLGALFALHRWGEAACLYRPQRLFAMRCGCSLALINLVKPVFIKTSFLNVLDEYRKSGISVASSI